MNRSRVVPARLRGSRVADGGPAEILLLRRRDPGRWEALARPGRRLPPHSVVRFADGLEARILDRTAAGGRIVAFSGPSDPDALILRVGRMPLPPYIKQWNGDPERYQTVYADVLGSAAAPTAGLHFTPELLSRIRALGVNVAYVTLHIGLDTFRPVRSDTLDEHEIHSEECSVPLETVREIERTRAGGGRIVCVGTTTVRALETMAASSADGPLGPWSGDTSLFILPGFRFRIVDALITNFHLPRSTLLALVSAFAGRDQILRAYQVAIEQRYRFFSFGDAMLIL